MMVVFVAEQVLVQLSNILRDEKMFNLHLYSELTIKNEKH